MADGPRTYTREYIRTPASPSHSFTREYVTSGAPVMGHSPMMGPRTYTRRPPMYDGPYDEYASPPIYTEDYYPPGPPGPRTPRY